MYYIVVNGDQKSEGEVYVFGANYSENTSHRDEYTAFVFGTILYRTQFNEQTIHAVCLIVYPLGWTINWSP